MGFTIGSLFDGSGGFPLAATLCGGIPVWASEIEPYPIAVTRSRFPSMKHLGDISRINGADIEPVDVITFGSPCQDLSVAGKRAGLKHEATGDEETTRSGLFMEAVRIIREMREATNGRYPTFALWENVPGAFSSNKGEDFRIVLEELVKIVEQRATVPTVPKNGWAYADSYCGDGWSLAYRVFDAQYWGVPQRRRRIHLVLDLRGERAGAVLFEREGVRGYFEEGGTERQETPRNAPDCAYSADREGSDPCDGVCGGGHATLTLKTWDARGNGDGNTVNCITGDHENRITDYTSVVVAIEGNGARPSHLGNGYRETDKMYTLNTVDRHSVAYAEMCVPIHDQRYIVRRLTPTECARLQGFADRWGDIDPKEDFTEEEYRFWMDVRNTHAAINDKTVKEYTKAQMLTWYNKLGTDSAEYKMWGNGIALPPALYCMQGIADILN